ncbi:1-deoxy-D-xylulose 5-phosphate reductoisomerase [Fodinibius salinus]|uniref:1-deoxy-D-xylulose 5-phosphate reductoisomerase n=1 Tax=Fodinibius salinus TaxID=860790 RepID=A0A5D3YPX5_9BACT|nr:1-deoxy-D-xylulose-5-phosphate reductoisomerase [Fodinibius salinus]TYP95099.1 1-deoxy-D-xylulose 5-phosphate reductoisomerase [Fodinibius salinus]
MVKQKNLVILGSTGSIGQQALEVVGEHPKEFSITALTCNTSWQKIVEQAKLFQPDYVWVQNKYIDETTEALSQSDTEVISGHQHLLDLATLDEADVILNSLVGYAGFEPTIEAIKADKTVALANKESLVVGGELINDLLGNNNARLIPVDSEHSAILQCLEGEDRDTMDKLIITASGGPFRTWTKQQMQDITVEDALDHPNWSMGAKITIDSATMMNKGLEIIEAYQLFDLPLSKIEAVVHPQSVIHSIVTFTDGSSKAQLGPPTMKVPILYALSYPDRLACEAPLLDWSQAFDLTFEPADTDRFPCLKLAIDAAKEGGLAPAILNAANEIAVHRFLNEEIAYIKIPTIIENCLNEISCATEISLDTLRNIDQQTRELALTL